MVNDNGMNNMKNNVLISFGAIFLLIIGIIGIAYAAWSYSVRGVRENTVRTGYISMSYNENTNGINITNAIPMTEAQGKALIADNQMFDFSVSATIKGSTTVHYEIAAKKDTDNMTQDQPIPDANIRLYLTAKDNAASREVNASGEIDDTGYSQVTAPTAFIPAAGSYGTPASEMVLYTGSFSNNSSTQTTYTKSFRLRMWVDSAYVVDGISRDFAVKINVYGA